MNNIVKTIILVLFSIGASSALAKEVTVVSGNFTAKKRTAELKTFAVSKGDVLEIKLTVDHKRRGLDIWMKQHPGDVFVLDYDKFRAGSKKIVAPADAIYQIFYGGARVDFNIEVINHTNKPNGPGRGDITYVCMPDTVYSSGYADVEIGESYTLSPYKEKVVLGTTINSEMVCNRDFFTGVDYVHLQIPGDVKDEYREQKLLGYSVSLTCQSPEVYREMMGLVTSGIDAFVKTPSFGLKKKKQPKKMNQNNRYEFTDDLQKESNKWETATELLEIAQEAADTLAPKSSTAEGLETAAFLMDTDGMKQLALEKGLKAAGAPEEMMAIMNAVDEIPSAADLLNDGLAKYGPKVKGSAHLNISEFVEVEKSVVELPQKEFWIQSAMNYGQNTGGCWDVPGHPTQAQKNLDIKCWSIDDGVDRKFKIVPSQKYPDCFEIHSALPGQPASVVDNRGGKGNMRNNGNDIHLWEHHGDKSQAFRFKHLGGGKFKIYNYDGHLICLKGKKNSNGTNIHIWHDHDGAFTEWYLVDPITKTAFVPGEITKKVKVIEPVSVVDKKGGAINETITLANADDALNTSLPYKDLFFNIHANGGEAKAKLIVEAKYRITDYTDVIKYKRTTQPVNTSVFWTNYTVKYNYGIMFKDQVRDYYKVISKSEYNKPDRPTEEVKKY